MLVIAVRVTVPVSVTTGVTNVSGEFTHNNPERETARGDQEKDGESMLRRTGVRKAANRT